MSTPEIGLSIRVKPGQSITIGPEITLYLARNKGGELGLVIRAPKNLDILRSNAVLGRIKGRKELEITRENNPAPPRAD